MGFGGFGDWSALTLDTAAETGGGAMLLRRRTPIAYAAAPTHVPAGGGAVIVVSGTRLADDAGASCVFILGDDPSGSPDRATSDVHVISSALGRCESPDVTAGTVPNSPHYTPPLTHPTAPRHLHLTNHTSPPPLTSLRIVFSDASHCSRNSSTDIAFSIFSALLQ